MTWISAIGPTNSGAIELMVQELDGSCRRAALSEVSESIGAFPGTHKSITLRLSELELASPATYLEGLGLGGHSQNGQTVYQCSIENRIYYIPAQILVISLFGHLKSVRNSLLTPVSPTKWASAFVTVDTLQIIPFIRRTDAIKPEQMQSLIKRMEWVLTYPSAAAAWNSIYRRARDGLFDMLLPNAEVRVSLHGRSRNGSFFASQMCVLGITPLEEPYAFAKSHAKAQFSFKSVEKSFGGMPAQTLVKVDAIIQKNFQKYELNDTQWARIEEILQERALLKSGFQNGRKSKHSVRAAINIIMLKFGNPYAWTKMPGNKLEVLAAKSLFHRLSVDGTWKIILQVLAIVETSSACYSR